MKDWRRAPVFGAGLGFRREIAPQILGACDDISVVELLADDFLQRGRSAKAEVADLAEIFALVPHGVSLSLASDDCLRDEEYLSRLEAFCRLRDFPYYSDHCALTKSGGSAIGHLSPIWRTKAQLKTMIRNVGAVSRRIGLPLVLENIAALFEIPGAELTEPAFLNELVQATGCGLLLDLENLHANALNHGFSARRWLNELDLDAVAQIHLAGGLPGGDYWIDTHSRPVQPAVLRLYEETTPRCSNLKCSIIERDAGFRGFTALLDEVRRAAKAFPAGRHLALR